MSLTLATVADALIEFILSLLRDPAAAAEFEDDPDAALAQRGLSHVSAPDVAAVAPVIIERTQVVQVAVPKPVPVEVHSNPAVREIQSITQHFQTIDDRDTIIDQSVNQNIWAHGDVTQTFDQKAVVASGDHAIAAGKGVDLDQRTDKSTHITAGDDVNIGNDTDVTTVDDSFNQHHDATTVNDGSATVIVNDALNDASTHLHDGHDATDDDHAAGGADDSDAAGHGHTTAPVAPVIVHEGDVLPDGDSIAAAVEGTVSGALADAADTVPAPADAQSAVAEAPVEQTPAEEVPAEQAPADSFAAPAAYADSAAQYAEATPDDDADAYPVDDAPLVDHTAAGDEF